MDMEMQQLVMEDPLCQWFQQNDWKTPNMNDFQNHITDLFQNFKKSQPDLYDEFVKIVSVLLALRHIPKYDEIEKSLYIRLIKCVDKYIDEDLLSVMNSLGLLPFYCEIDRNDSISDVHLKLKGKLIIIPLQEVQEILEIKNFEKISEISDPNSDEFLERMEDYVKNLGGNYYERMWEHCQQFVQAYNFKNSDEDLQTEQFRFITQLKSYLGLTELLQGNCELLEGFLEFYPLPVAPIECVLEGISFYK